MQEEEADETRARKASTPERSSAKVGREEDRASTKLSESELTSPTAVETVAA